MNELLYSLEYVRAYIDDLLIISNGNYEDHLDKTKLILRKLTAAGFKISAVKSIFTRDNSEYLGLKTTRHSIVPLPDKVQAIKDVAAPTNKKQLINFIGVINYYLHVEVWSSFTSDLIICY